jgi:ketosteroid isomerase-like protein
MGHCRSAAASLERHGSIDAGAARCRPGPRRCSRKSGGQPALAYNRAVHPSEKLIHSFYSSFQQRDAAGMGACYADDVAFSDPVFPDLRGDAARAMWTMLCRRARDFELRFRDVVADDHHGRAHWEAEYTYSQTGRRVHNIIEASFELRDGRIVRHTDRFDLWRWMRMALGAKGVILGWLPHVQGVVRRQANQALEAFMRSEAASASPE